MKMKKKWIIILLLTTCCHVLTTATEIKSYDIPEDSLTSALGNSFRLKLDSAIMYEAQGDYMTSIPFYESGLEDMKRYHQYRREHIAIYLDSIFQTEQKEDQLAYLNETVELKRIQNLLLIILGLVIGISLVFLFSFLSYRLRSTLQRTAHEENAANLSRLEKERRELEIRLHEVEAEKIQKELLAESLLVEYKNKVVSDLDEFLTQNPDLNNYKNELETIFREETICTEKLEKQPTGIHEIHPQFSMRLQEKANHKLTSLDLEYCRLILLNMSSKEMADILKVDPKTIRVGKYRLKQKLGLNKEQDLNIFIASVGVASNSDQFHDHGFKELSHS